MHAFYLFCSSTSIFIPTIGGRDELCELSLSVFNAYNLIIGVRHSVVFVHQSICSYICVYTSIRSSKCLFCSGLLIHAFVRLLFSFRLCFCIIFVYSTARSFTGLCIPFLSVTCRPLLVFLRNNPFCLFVRPPVRFVCRCLRLLNFPLIILLPCYY